MKNIVPANATAEVTDAFREIHSILLRWETTNVAFKGRRIIDAGDAISDRDYVTLGQLTSLLRKIDSRIGKIESQMAAGEVPRTGFATSGDI